MKLHKDNEIEFCQEYTYLGVIFDTSETDDKEIRSRVIQARKCIACLNGILWSKDIRQERKLNIYNALIKSSLLHGSETWRLTENNKRRVEATEMDALRRSSRTVSQPFRRRGTLDLALHISRYRLRKTYIFLKLIYFLIISYLRDITVYCC